MDVIYTGLHRTPEEVVVAAAQEGCGCFGCKRSLWRPHDNFLSSHRANAGGGFEGYDPRRQAGSFRMKTFRSFYRWE